MVAAGIDATVGRRAVIGARIWAWIAREFGALLLSDRACRTTGCVSPGGAPDRSAGAGFPVPVLVWFTLRGKDQRLREIFGGGRPAYEIGHRVSLPHYSVRPTIARIC
jgi:hypothetical protein